MGEAASDYTAIVGIDFGTTRSGYHFAYTKDPATIYPNKSWDNAPPNAKTLTELLLNRNDLSVRSFGFEARHEFVFTEDHSHLLYFANFKTILHNAQGATRGEVGAINCDINIPTEKLLSICLRVLVRTAIEQLQSSKTVVLDHTRIRWVITVPAIWDMPARLAMETALEQAGVPRRNIICALEPEAAILACLDLETDNIHWRENDCLVVDAGGGTVDITVHRNRLEGGLVELHSPTGGMWGSNFINERFELLLEDVLGAELIAAARKTPEWYEMMDSFERAKVNFKPNGLGVHVSINAIVAKLTEHELNDKINTYNTRSNQQLKLGRNRVLQIGPVMLALFEPFIVNIVNHVANLLALPELQHVRYLFLVGGFAESVVLRTRMEQEFGNRVHLVIPPQPGISVMKGAVRFGFNPSIIKERIMQQTIGIEVLELWNEKKHAGREKIMDEDNQARCHEVRCFVYVNERISVDTTKEHDFFALYSHLTSVSLTVIGSCHHELLFADDPGAREIGTLTVQIPDVGTRKRLLSVAMKFAGTTFTATATYTRTGEATSAMFNLGLDA